MSFLSLLRNPATLGVLNITTLLGVTGGTYLLRSHMKELSEDHEARMNFLPLLALSHSQCPQYAEMASLWEERHRDRLREKQGFALSDELEGTLRGHIGLIEEALDRLEGKATEADRGKKMNDYYSKRARDGTNQGAGPHKI